MRVFAQTAMAMIVATGAANAARAAEPRPNLLPVHDGAVTYALSGSARDLPKAAKVSFKAGARQVRIESDSQPGPLLIDRAAGQANMVLANTHLVVRVGLGDMIDKYLLDPQAHFARLGTDRVAGVDCTRWHMQSPQAEGEGCVAADGVVLKIAGHDRKGQSLHAEATAISAAPQPDALFQPPDDAQTLSLSNLGRSIRLPQ